MTEPKTSQMEAGHTPLPWKSDCFLVTSGRDWICHCGGMLHPAGPRATEAEANAAFIAKACNSHNSLLSACEGALKSIFCGYSGQGELPIPSPNGRCDCEHCHAARQLQSAIGAAGGGKGV